MTEVTLSPESKRRVILATQRVVDVAIEGTKSMTEAVLAITNALVSGLMVGSGKLPNGDKKKIYETIMRAMRRALFGKEATKQS
jgi:hypothetical protein